MGHLIELSHVLENGTDSYPGLPRPSFGPLLDHEASRPNYEGKAEFYLGKAEFACNTGTYLDSPFHRYREGDDLADVSIERVASLPGLVFDCTASAERSLTLDIADLELEGCAILVMTGWDRTWGTRDYWEPGPFISDETVDALVARKAALAGVDFYNVDDTSDPSRPAHTGLLAGNVLVVENLCNLELLPTSGFRFYAVPLRIKGGASFPVRAFADVGG